MQQTSYCYLAKIKTVVGPPDFTEKEKRNGFEVAWFASLNQAQKAMEESTPLDAEGTSIRVRDLAILAKAQEVLSGEGGGNGGA